VEVEATLKPGSKHIYGKRTFYLDEDSWSRAVRGRLRQPQATVAREHPPVDQFYDAKVPWYRRQHLARPQQRSYLLSNLDNEIKAPWKFGEKAAWGDFHRGLAAPHRHEVGSPREPTASGRTSTRTPAPRVQLPVLPGGALPVRLAGVRLLRLVPRLALAAREPLVAVEPMFAG